MANFYEIFIKMFNILICLMLDILKRSCSFSFKFALNIDECQQFIFMSPNPKKKKKTLEMCVYKTLSPAPSPHHMPAPKCNI